MPLASAIRALGPNELPVSDTRLLEGVVLASLRLMSALPYLLRPPCDLTMPPGRSSAVRGRPAQICTAKSPPKRPPEPVEFRGQARSDSQTHRFAGGRPPTVHPAMRWFLGTARVWLSQFVHSSLPCQHLHLINCRVGPNSVTTHFRLTVPSPPTSPAARAIGARTSAWSLKLETAAMPPPRRFPMSH
jgi:hypothetical protein